MNKKQKKNPFQFFTFERKKEGQWNFPIESFLEIAPIGTKSLKHLIEGDDWSATVCQFDKANNRWARFCLPGLCSRGVLCSHV